MRLFFLALIILAIFPAVTMAQSGFSPKMPKALQEMVDQGAQVHYLGEFEGMKGWALIRQGKPEFFYQNREGTAMVMGLMFNQDAEMVTMGQLRALHQRVGDDMYAVTGGSIANANLPPLSDSEKSNNTSEPVAVADASPASAPAPVVLTPPLVTARNLTPAKRMYADLLGTNWVTMNPQGKYDLFAFIDPDCPHCMNFIKDVEPMMINGGLRIRVIPIGMTDQSLKKAAVLLSSSDPQGRVLKYAKGDKSALSAPNNINTKGVEKNVTTMLKHEFDVTPIIVYRTGKGEIRLIRGRPSNYETILNDIVQN